MTAEEMVHEFELRESSQFDVNPIIIILWLISLLSFYFSFRVYVKFNELNNKTIRVDEKQANSIQGEPEGVVRLRRMSDSYDSRPKVAGANHPIYRIWITGGPCAGKTTSLATLRTELQEKGFKVLEVPEAATLMMKGGCFIQTSTMTFAQAVKFQISLMKMQMNLEDIFIDIAINAERPCVVLMDRGVMDGSAYTSPKIWKAILNETGWTTIQLRDRRYDAVWHLVTAADGAEEFYGKNNEARYESVQQAKEVDLRLINAWTGHPHLKIIDNAHKGGFKGKIQVLIKTVMKYVGLPEMAHVQKKFLLAHDGEGRFIIDEPTDLKRETFEVEEVFLVTKSKEMLENKIRSRGKEDSYTYIHETRSIVQGEEIIMKRQITAREFIQLGDQKDVNKKPIEKIRHCFIYKNQNFVVDVFQNVVGKPTILRIETNDKDEVVNIPPFVQIIREVTGDKNYLTNTMTSKDYQTPKEDIENCIMENSILAKKNSVSLSHIDVRGLRNLE